MDIKIDICIVVQGFADSTNNKNETCPNDCLVQISRCSVFSMLISDVVHPLLNKEIIKMKRL